MTTQNPPRLVQGIHRDIAGRADEPVEFYLLVDRGLSSGKLDRVDVSEDEILALMEDGAKALRMIRKQASR